MLCTQIMMKLVATSLLAVTAACAAPATDGGGAPTVFPDTQIFSGADPAGGGTPYAVTIAAMGATGMSWTSSNASIATISGTDSLGTVSAVAVGTATLTAAAGGTTLTIPLTVNSYSAAELSAGAAAWSRVNCAMCHGPGATTGGDVGPADIGKHTDDQVIGAITAGQNPEGGEVSIGAASHSFAMSGADEMRGIVAYLRSLPAGIPVADD